MPPKSRAFWPLAFLLLLADCASKRLAVEHLDGEPAPLEVVGEALRFTLTYNPGAAFSFSLGDHSRLIFSVLAICVIAVLVRMYRDLEPADHAMGASLGLVVGGAFGNLLDRLRSERGVVDFIDLGVAGYRFWTFNIADIGVTTGAVLLLVLMFRRPTSPQPANHERHSDGSDLRDTRM
ncbi:MAG: signal peptidase II [Gemmatimonadota bacterium]